MTRATTRLVACALTALTLTGPTSIGCGAPGKIATLVVQGNSRELRKREKGTPPNSPDRPSILLLAFDGIDRALIYDMLKKDELPQLALLLGGLGGTFGHAHFDETLLSTMPSSTMAAWTTAMTGVPPSKHGVTGNEFFIRETRKLGAPAPVTFADSKPTLAIYTDAYLDSLKLTPSVYERMRATDPNILVWVAVHQIYSGADRLLLTKPTILTQAFETFVEEQVGKVGGQKPQRGIYAKVDQQVVDVVTEELESGPLPDVLTVYLSGTDLYAHVAEEGPDEARRVYLREVVDPAMGKLRQQLEARQALDNRFIVLTSDHGHTQVLHDVTHALDSAGPDEPPALMQKAGYRLRPFQMDVPDTDSFDAVLASGGATAFIYVADRSTCAKDKPCDWTKPPRYEQDVLPMADAFFTNNEDGALVPAMKGTLDLVLTRVPRPYAEDDLPFEVYVGHGKTVGVDEYLRTHPHPTYIDTASRLRDLAAGPHGERAGDVMLIAHNGDRDTPQERFYFAAPYRSWHGSPSKKDSEIPLIVAHPHYPTEKLRALVAGVLGHESHQQKVAELLLALRAAKE